MGSSPGYRPLWFISFLVFNSFYFSVPVPIDLQILFCFFDQRFESHPFPAFRVRFPSSFFKSWLVQIPSQQHPRRWCVGFTRRWRQAMQRRCRGFWLPTWSGGFTALPLSGTV